MDKSQTALAPVVWLTQAPEFGERLSALKAEWDTLAAEAEAMEVSDENRTEARKCRADIRKRFDEIENQRKAALAPVREKIDAFQAVYKECVTDAFNRADGALKGKIEAIESQLKTDCERRMKAYWKELCAGNGIDFFPFEDIGVELTLTDARQKTPKKLMKVLYDLADETRRNVEAISKMEYSTEIMVEFRKTRNLVDSIEIVRNRHSQIEAEQRAAQARQEAERRQAEAVAKVEAAASEVLTPPVPVTEEAAFPDTFAFTIHFESAAQWEAVRPVLLNLRDTLKAHSVRYE